MSNSIFQFGQPLPGYDVPVLNERAVRASAGILFLLAMVSFMNAWMLGNFQPTRLFVLGFLVDFTIRVFINPGLAPSLIIGQWIVRKQQPEWVGAPQKRFAWVIGFLLALIMWYLVVLNNVIGPINLVVCALCLSLLFFETAFGICIGCTLYQFIRQKKAQLCPGAVCAVEPAQVSGPNVTKVAIVAVFAGLIVVIAQWVQETGAPQSPQRPGADITAPAPVLDPAEAERCKVPDFAKAMGHEEKWKLHNHCK